MAKNRMFSITEEKIRELVALGEGDALDYAILGLKSDPIQANVKVDGAITGPIRLPNNV